MPKYQYGILIQCEKSVRVYLEFLNTKRAFIIKKLDETHLLINDGELEYIQDEIYKMQDQNTFLESSLLK